MSTAKPESVYETQYNWKDTSPTMAIIESVSNVEETEPDELEPIYRAIDPDALDTVITDSEDVEVSFVYSGQHVTVDSTGRVRLEPETRHR